MDRPILLSVVVPVSNMAGKLQNLKTWLSHVPWDNCEVLIVHDQIDKATSLEIKEIVELIGVKNLKLYEGVWGNPGQARNFGLGHCSGDWVVFWDSDDLPKPLDVIEAIEDASNKDNFLVGGFEIYDTSNNRFLQKIVTTSLIDISITPGIWRIVFRRETIQNCLFPALRMGEDQVFLIKSSIYEATPKFYPNSFYTYFVGNPSQLTNSREDKKKLHEAVMMTGELLTKTNNTSKKYISIVYIKQLFSMVKHGSVRDKTQAVYKLLQFIKKNSKNSLRALREIFKHSVLKVSS